MSTLDGKRTFSVAAHLWYNADAQALWLNEDSTMIDRRFALLMKLGAGAVITTGCATPSAETQPAAAERLLNGCNAPAAQKLVGAPATEATGREAQRLAGASVLRWIKLGDPVSHDFNSGRINLEIDARRVLRISCG
jgi:hypothetical protein